MASKCFDCKYYEREKEYHNNAENWKLAPCFFHKVDVPGIEQTCDDFVVSPRPAYHKQMSRAKGKSKNPEAPRIKGIILGNPEMKLKDLEKLTGISLHMCSLIRNGYIWQGVTVEGEE